MPQILISFKPYASSSLDLQIHNLGNIADSIWVDKLALSRGEFCDGRYVGHMDLLGGVKLRKKEKDELRRRLKVLAIAHPELEPKLIFQEEK